MWTGTTMNLPIRVEGAPSIHTLTLVREMERFVGSLLNIQPSLPLLLI